MLDQRLYEHIPLVNFINDEWESKLCYVDNTRSEFSLYVFIRKFKDFECEYAHVLLNEKQTADVQNKTMTRDEIMSIVDSLEWTDDSFEEADVLALIIESQRGGASGDSTASIFRELDEAYNVLTAKERKAEEDRKRREDEEEREWLDLHWR